ncbi:MAG: ABC transporter ATP-binding protein [Candidatus Woesearchaeota archaeon]|jgi:ATP-binding cassette subfamily B protein
MEIKEEKITQIDMKYNLKFYFKLLFKYKFLLFMTLFMVLLTDFAAVADKYLFKRIFDDGTLFAAGTLTKSVFIQTLSFLAILFAGIILINVISRWYKLHLVNRLDANLILDVKQYFFNHIISLSHNFHTSHKTGSLISRLTRGARAVESMTDIIVFNITPLLFQLVIVFFSVVYFDFTSAMIIIITVLIFLLFSYLIQQKQQKFQMASNDAEDFEKGKIADFLTNIESIKYFGKDEYIKKEFSNITDNTRKTTIEFWDWYRWLFFGQAVILGIGTFFIIYFPLMNFLAGTTTLGTLLFIYTVFGTLLNPLYDFSRGMREFYKVMGDFESLFQYSKIQNEVKDNPDSKQIKISNGKIEFNNISFKYDKRKIFEEFSLKIPAGNKVAIVGHSGSGKSTLIKILYRLYDVNSGKILIDNVNIKDVKQHTLREEMSIVPQECVLFDDTIYNNIAFSNPKATREEVFSAMKFAQLDKIVETFPNKENTIVGERGIKLSGGEKQRVSIARAILANKKILLLDEATSSLDSQTEHDIQEDLEKLMKKRTSIIIAHRLSTIMKADKIVVMKSGNIVQMGKHNDLIKVKGEYQKLWRLQKGGYIK